MTVTVYPGPGTDSFRCPRFAATAAAVGGTQQSVYVYGISEVAQSDSALWQVGDTVLVSWATVAADEPVQAVISLPEGPVRSVEIYPRNVVTASEIVSNELRITVPPNSRLRIELNGDRRNALHFVVSPPQAAIPGGSIAYNGTQTSVAANTTMHFPAGAVHLVAADFDLNDNATLIIPGGAVVVFLAPGASQYAGFNSTGLTSANLTGVKIRGHGVITSLASHLAAQTATPFSAQLKYAMLVNESLTPQNISVDGVTFAKYPFYLNFGAAHYFRNVTVLCPWFYNCDGPKPARKSLAESVGTVLDSFVYVGDDGIGILAENQQTVAEGCFVVSPRAFCYLLGYFGELLQDSRTMRILDCHAMNVGQGDTGWGYAQPDGAGAIIGGWVDQTNANGATRGHANVEIDNLRVWGPMNVRLFSLKNFLYPFTGVAPAQAAGQIQNIVFRDVQTESVPGQRSQLLGRDASNTPHDITFEEVFFGGTKLTESNRSTYIDINSFPYDLTFDTDVPQPVAVTSDAQFLWAAVESSYDADGLITLTNIRDRNATAVNQTAGWSACQGVIDLWSVYAQTTYDATNRTHVETAKRAVIALLWARGGAAATIAKVEWDEVFSADGMLSKVKQTGPRGRTRPTSNSGVLQKREANMGQPVRGWSDPDSLPVNYLPLRRIARDD